MKTVLTITFIIISSLSLRSQSIDETYRAAKQAQVAKLTKEKEELQAKFDFVNEVRIQSANQWVIVRDKVLARIKDKELEDAIRADFAVIDNLRSVALTPESQMEIEVLNAKKKIIEDNERVLAEEKEKLNAAIRAKSQTP